MERDIDLKEVSDGKLYGVNDMVRADCCDCKGCSACCRGMGESIVLDPFDISRLSDHLNLTFEGLMKTCIGLHVEDGLILPHLSMEGPGEACTFLNQEGRCKIHAARPGICRIFPLGRLYENRSFQYFLQIHECKNQNRAKVKVKKWIDVANIRENGRFISRWHYFLKDLQSITKTTQDAELRKKISMQVLNQFFMWGFDLEDFYQQFHERMDQAEAWMQELKGTKEGESDYEG